MRCISLQRELPHNCRMSISELYKHIVLEHNRAPRNAGALAGHTHAADGANPMCGDSLRCEALCCDGRIVDLRFSGESCAITTATASILSEQVRGMDAQDLAQLRDRFAALLRMAVDSPEDPVLRELNALAELRRYPARQKCALLPFATLAAALSGLGSVSTEH
jgi:nitrogen fixation protein NifU and related proteins